MLEQEKRLLDAIFSVEEDEEAGFPETFSEKAGYAEYVLHKALESLSPTLRRLSCFRGLLQVCEEDGKVSMPSVIAQNETRMVLEHLVRLKSDVDEAYREINAIHETARKTGAQKEVAVDVQVSDDNDGS